MHHADTAALVLGLVLVAFLVPIALIDLDHRIIPNRMTLPAAVVADRARHGAGSRRARSSGSSPAPPPAGSSRCPRSLRPNGMGMGDAKLVAVLGLFLGAAVAPALFVAFVVGTAIGIAIIARKGMVQGRKTAVPFGPFLALGGVVAVLAGNELVSMYLGTF